MPQEELERLRSLTQLQEKQLAMVGDTDWLKQASNALRLLPPPPPAPALTSAQSSKVRSVSQQRGALILGRRLCRSWRMQRSGGTNTRAS